MIYTVIVALNIVAILSATLFWVNRTNSRRVWLRAWLMELEIERNDEPKPRRRALPPRAARAARGRGSAS